MLLDAMFLLSFLPDVSVFLYKLWILTITHTYTVNAHPAIVALRRSHISSISLCLSRNGIYSPGH